MFECEDTAVAYRVVRVNSVSACQHRVDVVSVTRGAVEACEHAVAYVQSQVVLQERVFAVIFVVFVHKCLYFCEFGVEMPQIVQLLFVKHCSSLLAVVR